MANAGHLFSSPLPRQPFHEATGHRGDDDDAHEQGGGDPDDQRDEEEVLNWSRAEEKKLTVIQGDMCNDLIDVNRCGYQTF